jgi:hypothetical protein
VYNAARIITGFSKVARIIIEDISMDIRFVASSSAANHVYADQEMNEERRYVQGGRRL